MRSLTGTEHTGVCICCGVEVSGQITVSRPEPFWTTTGPLGDGDRVKAVLIKGDRGVHEVPWRTDRLSRREL